VVTILDDGLEKDHPDIKRNYVSIRVWTSKGREMFSCSPHENAFHVFPFRPAYPPNKASIHNPRLPNFVQLRPKNEKKSVLNLLCETPSGRVHEYVP
jgi:hypothetical protein